MLLGVASEPVPAVVGTISVSRPRRAIGALLRQVAQRYVVVEQDGYDLGHIHRATAADPDDQVAGVLSGRCENGFDLADFRFGRGVVKDGYGHPGCFEQGFWMIDQASSGNALVADDQNLGGRKIGHKLRNALNAAWPGYECDRGTTGNKYSWFQLREIGGNGYHVTTLSF